LKSPEILRRLVRRVGLLLLLTLVGGTAGAVYSAVKTPTYTAKAFVVAIGDNGDSITALNFAQAYGRIATSGPVLAKAGTTLGINTTGLSQVTASTSPDAPVIEIAATGTSAQHTADLANAVANALADYGTTRKSETHVGLALLAGALVPRSASSPKPPLELIVGAAGGLLIGGLAVLAGVGRAPARQKVARAQTESEPAQYEVAEVDDVADVDDEPDGGPAEIERYMGVWRSKYPPRAITAYGKATTPAFLTTDADDEGADEAEQPDASIPAQRVIGRAVVSRTEDQ
jgi:capsular polysaccharide biosynthesis protein